MVKPAKKRIKVIHIITKLELGGAQQTTLYTLAHLDRSRYIPVLICGPSGILLPEARRIPGLKIHVCPHLIREISPYHDFLALISIRRIILSERMGHEGPVIVHTHSSKAGIVGRCAAWLAGISIRIHSVHGFGFNPYQPPLMKWGLIASEIFTGILTTKMIFVSRDNLRDAIRLCITNERKACIIRSGIEWERFTGIGAERIDRIMVRNGLGISGDTMLIGMIACFKPQKAPLDFIRMAYLVCQRFPETHFMIAGDGELRKEIEEVINVLGLQDNILLLGWRRDIPELIRAMDIMVLTSLWEGLPKVVIEAQLMGVPVIATRTSGVNEIIQDGINGFLVTPKRPDVMARKVIELLDMPGTLKRMGFNAKSSVPEEFDLKRIVKAHEGLYEDLV